MNEVIVTSDLIRIISKAASGNSDGIQQLKERIMPDIASFVQNSTGSDSPQIAEYIFQTVVERLNELENAKQFYRWLETIENEIIESVIKQADHYSPDQSTEILQKAMSTFTDDQRTVFLMYYYDGKTIPEIAREIHKDEAVVHDILEYSKTKLTEQICELQEKDGLKLYDLAPLPFVLYLIHICKGAGVAKTAISTSAVSMAAGSYSGAAVGGSAATKAAGISIATKVAIGAAVTVAAAGGGYTAYRVVEKHNAEVAEVSTESGTDSISYEAENQEIAADEATAETDVVTETDTAETTDVSMIAGDYWYSSGAGAWEMHLTIHKDGSVDGGYHDTDSGGGLVYPEAMGTVYYDNYTGTITDLEKTSELTYQFQFTDIQYNEEESVYLEDTTEYHIDNISAPDFSTDWIAYLPGTDITGLPAGIVDKYVGIEPIESQGVLAIVVLYDQKNDAIYYGEKG